nr:hypothetical protein [Bacillus wudalianchiensis]
MNGGIVAAPTAEATEILPVGLFSLYKNDGTAFKELVMRLFTVSMLGSVIANRPRLFWSSRRMPGRSQLRHSHGCENDC